jgi:hypothetical protein
MCIIHSQISFNSSALYSNRPRRIVEMVLEYNPVRCKEKTVIAQGMKFNKVKGPIEKKWYLCNRN